VCGGVIRCKGVDPRRAWHMDWHRGAKERNIKRILRILGTGGGGGGAGGGGNQLFTLDAKGGLSRVRTCCVTLGGGGAGGARKEKT